MYSKVEYFEESVSLLQLETTTDSFEQGFYDVILEQKQGLYNQIETLEGELTNIDQHISDLNYNQFALEQRFVTEDSQALEATLDNKRGLITEYQDEITWLSEFNDAYLQVDADGNPTVQPNALSTEDKADYDANMERIRQLNTSIDNLNDEVQTKVEEKEAKEEARLDQEAQRIADEQIAAEQYAAEEKQRAINENKRAIENAESNI